MAVMVLAPSARSTWWPSVLSSASAGLVCDVELGVGLVAGADG